MDFICSNDQVGRRDWLFEINRFRNNLLEAQEIVDCEDVLKVFVSTVGKMPNAILDRVDEIYNDRLHDLLGINPHVPIQHERGGTKVRAAQVEVQPRTSFPTEAFVFWTRSLILFLLAFLAMQILIPAYLNRYVFVRTDFRPPIAGPEPKIVAFKGVAQPLK